MRAEEMRHVMSYGRPPLQWGRRELPSRTPAHLLEQVDCTLSGSISPASVGPLTVREWRSPGNNLNMKSRGVGPKPKLFHSV